MKRMQHTVLVVTARVILCMSIPLLAGRASAQLIDSTLQGQVSAQSPASAVTHTPRPVRDGSASLIAHYDPTKMLRLAISLNLPHPDEEAQFLRDLQNKHSSSYHRYLSSDEWDSRFGPSVEDEQAVVDWASSQGFSITYRYPNRLIVDVEAPAGVIEKALQVTINAYRHPFADGSPAETVFSNDREPVLPPNIDRIVHGIHGLNSFEHYSPASNPHSHVARPDYLPGPAIAKGESIIADAKNMTDATTPAGSAVLSQAAPLPQLGSPPAGYYQPTDIWSAGAYDYLALMNQGHCCNPTNNAGSTPPTTSIAVVTLGDVSYNDITLFQQAFPYLAYNFQKELVDGGYGTCKTNDDNCLEVTLDAEWSLSTSNSRGAGVNTAKIFLYEAPNNSSDVLDVMNHMLSDDLARTFTQSFGCAEKDACTSEGTMQDQDKVFAQMVGMGWTLVAASGDAGSTAACNDNLLVGYPASDPYVIAAGGTQLELYNNDIFSSEIGWTGGTSTGDCKGNDGGSTGGFSYLWSAPDYQSSLGFSQRAVPDLALNAAVGQIIVFNGAYGAVGGTSIVSPMLAGFFAQENAYLLSIGNACGAGTSPCAPLGDAHYPIYDEALHPSAAHIPFYDILSGCGSNDITAEFGLTAYCAQKGYDEVTGWGSANMLQLAWAINWENTASAGVPYTSFSGPTVNRWYNSNQTVSWTIEDYTAGSPVGTGIAGFSQSWDAVTTDSTTQPHGETTFSTDAFFTGPQYHNISSGCLALVGDASCAGGVVQGCHTAHVRGWNNQGYNTGDTTYGPICYDTVAPTSRISLSGTLSGTVYVSSVVATLSSSDPGAPTTGSGIQALYFSVDDGATTQYTSPVTISAPGFHYIVYYSVDKAGNVESGNLTGFTIQSPTTTTTLSANSLAFANETVHQTSAAKVVTVSNAGNASVTFSTITLNGAQADDFAMTSSCGSTLKANASCTISVTFTPVSPGPKAASISITDNSSGSPYTVSLSGTGVTASEPAVKLSAASLAFANQAVKTTSAAKSITLTNDGTGSLSISGIVLGGGQADDYSVTKTCGSTLGAGASCIISVSFTPVSTGPKSASISISDNASGSPQTVTLTGTGVNSSAPAVTLSATSLNFGAQKVKTSSTAKTVTLRNAGSGSLSIASITLTGGQADDFALSNTCGSTLGAGATCTISVTFTPVSTGSKSTSIDIADNASGSPQVVSLTGDGE